MVNKVTFLGFRVGDRPNLTPLDPPLLPTKHDVYKPNQVVEQSALTTVVYCIIQANLNRQQSV